MSGNPVVRYRYSTGGRINRYNTQHPIQPIQRPTSESTDNSVGINRYSTYCPATPSNDIDTQASKPAETNNITDPITTGISVRQQRPPPRYRCCRYTINLAPKPASTVDSIHRSATPSNNTIQPSAKAGRIDGRKPVDHTE